MGYAGVRRKGGPSSLGVATPHSCSFRAPARSAGGAGRSASRRQGSLRLRAFAARVQVTSAPFIVSERWGVSSPSVPHRGRPGPSHPCSGPPASAPSAGRRVPAAVRRARRPAIVRAPPLLNIHTARAPRPAPSPAGFGLGVCFRSFFLPGKERGSCFLSPQNIFSVSRFSSSLAAAAAPSLPASLSASAPASRVIFVSLPRAHSLNSRRRRGPTLRARPPGARRGARGAGAGA